MIVVFEGSLNMLLVTIRKPSGTYVTSFLLSRGDLAYLHGLQGMTWQIETMTWSRYRKVREIMQEK